MTMAVAGLEFLDNQNLFILIQSGQYLIFNPYTKALGEMHHISTPGDPDLQMDPIVCTKLIGNTVIFLTQNYVFYMKDIGAEGPKIRLPITEVSAKLNEYSLNFAVWRDNPRDPIDIYIPTMTGGVLRMTASAKGTRSEFLLKSIADPVIYCAVSPMGHNMAALTKGNELHVINLRGPIKEWRKPLSIQANEFVYFQDLRWISCYGLAVVFKTKIKIALYNPKENFVELSDHTTSHNRTSGILTKSEIDGLRVIRIFENSPEQSCSIIRKQPNSYYYVKREEVDKPVRALLSLYQAYANNTVLRENDVREDKKSLNEAVNELIEVGCFEIEEVTLA